jgi:hypothetical protein
VPEPAVAAAAAGEISSVVARPSETPAEVESDETVDYVRPVLQPPLPPLITPTNESTIVQAFDGLPDAGIGGDLQSEADPLGQGRTVIAGYRVRRRVGRVRVGGGYRATRRGLGQDVALTVVRPRWGNDSGFAARFALEAYVAGRLEHPNLVTPEEVGVDRGLIYVGARWVDDPPLSDPSRGRAGLDRTARVAAILHAARALRHAHEQGVPHRDFSLDKIRVDDRGLVRVVDLGLGLTPDAPIQTDPRVDIAALGGALQTLLSGGEGMRAVPPGLAATLRRIKGDDPSETFHDLGAVVRALETELGLASPAVIPDDEAREVEAAATEFASPPLLPIRRLLTLGFATGIALFALLLLLVGKPISAAGFAGLGLLTASALVVIQGVTGRDPIFDRVRRLVLGGGPGDLLTVAVGVVLTIASLLATGLLGVFLFLLVLAVGLAVAYHVGIDRAIARERQTAVLRAWERIKGLRRTGVAEEEIRRLVARQGGGGWEEFYETLFGYEALRAARGKWGADAGGQRRARFARWRDPIVDLLDRRLESRSQLADRAVWEALQERNFEARGQNLLTARRKSRRVAEAIVTLAQHYRTAPDHSLGLPLLSIMTRAVEKPDDYLTTTHGDDRDDPPFWRTALERLVDLLAGPRARFLLGATLLAGFCVWTGQNALVPNVDLKQDVQTVADLDHEKAIAEARKVTGAIAESVQAVAEARTATRPLELRFLPVELTRRLDGFGLGAAGLILVASAFFRGVRLAFFVLPAAVVAVLGASVIEPGAHTLSGSSLVALAVAAGGFALGMVFGRERN